MTGSPAEALLAAHEMQRPTFRRRENDRPLMIWPCKCGTEFDSVPLTIRDRDYLLHLIEAARTVTAEQLEEFRFALINYEHKVASAIDAGRFDEPDQDTFVARVISALGLVVEGGDR